MYNDISQANAFYQGRAIQSASYQIAFPLDINDAVAIGVNSANWATSTLADIYRDEANFVQSFLGPGMSTVPPDQLWYMVQTAAGAGPTGVFYTMAYYLLWAGLPNILNFTADELDDLIHKIVFMGMGTCLEL